MSNNEAVRKEIKALVMDIEYLQRECGVDADPFEVDEALEIIRRIEWKMRAMAVAP